MADIFRRRGPAWRASHAGHVSLGQLKVMSAIERCRTAELGGHVERCEECAHLRISYNSCRNRHCPKCQAAAAKEWLADRQNELLPVPYFHVVFTLPRPIADIAYQNKAVVYDLLLKTAAETLITIAAESRHLNEGGGSMDRIMELIQSMAAVAAGTFRASRFRQLGCRDDSLITRAQRGSLYSSRSTG